METGEVSAQLAGNGPFLIDTMTGELHVLGTAEPMQYYLDEYIKNKAAKLGLSSGLTLDLRLVSPLGRWISSWKALGILRHVAKIAQDLPSAPDKPGAIKRQKFYQ